MLPEPIVADPHLLSLQHRLVFQRERLFNHTPKKGRELLVLGLELARGAIEIVRGGTSLWRHIVQRQTAGLRRTRGARHNRTGLQHHQGRSHPLNMGPDVGATAWRNQVRISWRWNHVVGKPTDVDAARLVLDGHFGSGDDPAKSSWVKIVRVTEIEYIVTHQFIVCGRMHISCDACQFRRIINKSEVGDCAWVCHIGISQPDPDRLVALDNRIGVNLHAARDRPVWIGHTSARSVESQTMVTTGQHTIGETAPGQGSKSVRASVLQRFDVAVRAAKENQRHLKDGSGKKAVGIEFINPAGLVPYVLEIHFLTSRRCRQISFKSRNGHAVDAPLQR